MDTDHPDIHSGADPGLIPVADDAPHWATGLPWADHLIDVGSVIGHGRRAFYPHTLPDPEPGRVVEVDQWRVEGHWLYPAGPRRGGLLCFRIVAPDGWVGAIASSHRGSHTPPWGQVRDLFPLLTRALNADRTGPARAEAERQVLARVLPVLRQAISEPDHWYTEWEDDAPPAPGTAADWLEDEDAYYLARWAALGARDDQTVAAIRAVEGLGFADRVATVDAGWDWSAPDTPAWLAAAVEHEWLRRHPENWGWAGVRALRDAGWTIPGVIALHTAAGSPPVPTRSLSLQPSSNPALFATARDWETRSRVIDWERLCGGARASLYLCAGIGYPEAQQLEEQGTPPDEETLRTLAALHATHSVT